MYVQYTQHTQRRFKVGPSSQVVGWVYTFLCFDKKTCEKNNGKIYLTKQYKWNIFKCVYILN